MPIVEHLIENALSFWERHNNKNTEDFYELFMNDVLLNEQSKETGIKMRDLWIITQYIQCTYVPHIQQKVISDYGYDIYENEYDD